MALFHRLPWHKRLRSLRLWQPIQAIEVTDTELRLKKGNAWESASWGDTKNAVLTKQEYMPQGRLGRRSIRIFTPEEAMDLGDIRRAHPHRFAGKVGIVTSEILSFDIRGRKVFIDISLLTPHFERDMELRNVLMEKLHPRVQNHPFGKRMGELFVIVSATFVVMAIVFSLLNLW